MMKGDVIRRGFYSQGNNNEVEVSATKKGNGHPYPSFIDPLHPRLDAEMAFSKSLRDAGVFIFVSNLEEYGHLVNPESFTTSHKHNDLYEIYTNQKDWERRYIHPNYSRIFATDETQGVDQPCQDVYWFPVVTEIFCQHLIEEMENFGQWSSGKNNVCVVHYFVYSNDYWTCLTFVSDSLFRMKDSLEDTKMFPLETST